MGTYTEEPLYSAPSDIDMARLPKSDLGNCRRMMGRFGDDMRYVPRLGWRVWADTHWAGDDEGESGAQRLAHQTADAIFGECTALQNEGKFPGEEEKDFQKRIGLHHRWSADSGNAGRTKAMLSQAEAYLRKDREEWDADEFTFNVKNGTLKFSRSEMGADVNLLNHSRADYCTQMAPVDYDPDAKAPRWEAHIERCIPDPEKRAYFQRWCGYILTGSVEEQMFMIMKGPGADGKSTTINALSHMMGGYSMQVSINTFLQNDHRSGADASPDLARLAGPARFVHVSEPKKNAKLDEAAIKTMTGGDKISARKLRQDIFEFYPVFKIVIPTNPLPIIKATDHGTWRRVKLFHWGNTIKDEHKDLLFERKLKKEASGILNYCLEGLSDWMAEGLNEPAVVSDAVRSYRGESDPMGDWLAERLNVGPQYGKTPLSELRDDYQQWCEANSHYVVKPGSFGYALGHHNINITDRTGGTSCRVGIEWKAGYEPQLPKHKQAEIVSPPDDGIDPSEITDIPPVSAYEDDQNGR